MQCKVFALRLDDSLSADLAALNVFLNAVDVVFMEQGLVQGHPAVWSVLVFYENRRGEPPPLPSAESLVKATLEVQARLEERDPEEAKLHETLRRWRADRAKREDVPVYIVAPNRLLDEIARVKPKSRGDLETLKGFGPKRLEKYGDELLKLIQSLTK